MSSGPLCSKTSSYSLRQYHAETHQHRVIIPVRMSEPINPVQNSLYTSGLVKVKCIASKENWPLRLNNSGAMSDASLFTILAYSQFHNKNPRASFTEFLRSNGNPSILISSRTRSAARNGEKYDATQLNHFPPGDNMEGQSPVCHSISSHQTHSLLVLCSCN